jgi:serine protease AprX
MERAILFTSLVFLGLNAFAGETIKMKNEILRPPQAIHSQVLGTGFVKSSKAFTPTLQRVYYILQFDGPIQSSWTLKLKKAGIKMGAYLPDDAYLVKIQTPREWAAVNSGEHIRAVVQFKTELRLSHDFAKVDPNHDVTSRVRLASESEISDFLLTAKQRNIPFILDSASGATLQIEALRSNIEKLADIEGVEWIEPSKVITTYDFDVSAADSDPNMRDNGDYSDLTGFESGTKLMNFESAYNRGLHGEDEIVAIADTGLDRGSLTEILDDFKGQILKGYALGFFAKTWADPQGHGTHTSGSIVGDGLSSGGMLRGGAYKSQLIMQSLWSPMLNNLAKLPNFDKIFGAVRRDDNAHIHSDSWGSPTDPGAYDTDASMVDEVSWNNPDMLIIFAAGNSGVDLDKDGHIDEGSIGSPGTAKNCLTVGASKNYVLKGGIQKPMKELRGGADNWGAEPIASSRLSETPNGMAAFSSIGPTQDGRLKPEIVAPGTNIISTRAQTSTASPLWGAYNDKYVYAGGTSMSTPLTAGAAAVVRQYLRQVGFADPSAALIKAVLIHGATDLFPGQFPRGAGEEFKTQRPNVNEGYGRVNVEASTNLSKARIIDEAVGLKTTEIKTYNVNVQAGKVVRATMTYTDHPASAGTAQALVNDLDLKIVDEGGHTYFPNHLNGPDEANNTEMVEFVADHTGNYTVSVRGRNVPKGRPGTEAQPYALILP